MNEDYVTKKIKELLHVNINIVLIVIDVDKPTIKYLW